MTSLVRCLTALVLLLAGLAVLGSASLNPDRKDWAECLRELVDARRQEDQLDQAARAVGARWAAQGELARQVIGGRLTLLEAAARFRDAKEAASNSFGGYGRWRHRPTAECLCRQVIDRVGMELRAAGVPPGGRALLLRLRAELAGRLARDGRVVLPGR